MIICLVTDRRRTDVLAQARAAVRAGVDLFQIRERDLSAAALEALTSSVVAIARGSSTRVVVNDRLDVAIAAGADGVHLRGDSLPISAVRGIVPAGFLVGRSVHSADEAASAVDADYLVAGTMFPSTSKPEATAWLGVEGLRAIVGVTPVPVLAIGGVTLDRLSGVAESGAAGVAAIGLLARSDVSGMTDVTSSLRRLFDTVRSRP